MVLIIAPAIDGLRKDWREAAANMGASTFSTGAGGVADPHTVVAGAVILLFGNAFGAQQPRMTQRRDSQHRDHPDHSPAARRRGQR